MEVETSARFSLPLAVPQTAKQLTINEGLTAIDAAVRPEVLGEVAASPLLPSLGQSWLVASGLSGGCQS